MQWTHLTTALLLGVTGRRGGVEKGEVEGRDGMEGGGGREGDEEAEQRYRVSSVGVRELVCYSHQSTVSLHSSWTLLLYFTSKTKSREPFLFLSSLN